MSFSVRPLRIGRVRSLRLASRKHIATHIVHNKTLSTYRDAPSPKSSLLENVLSKNIPAIHKSYPALIAELKEPGVPSTSKTTSPLNRTDILKLLEVLAASGSPPELQRINDILSDLQPMFGIIPDREIHTAVIRGLIRTGNLQKASAWLAAMPKKAGNVLPAIEQFHLVLEAFVNAASFKSIRLLVKNMRGAGCPPTNETYMFLLQSRWNDTPEDKVPKVDVFAYIFDDMKLENLPFDPKIESFLQDRYSQSGFKRYSEQIQELYRSYFEEETPEKLQALQFNRKLSKIASTQGISTGIEFLKSNLKGRSPSPSALRSLFRYSTDTKDFTLLQSEFGIKPTVDLWSLLVSNNVRAGKTQVALTLYEQCKSAGISPDAALIDPLIHVLCQGPVPSSITEPIDVALSIFRDLQECSPTVISTPKEHYHQHSAGPDSRIYHNLLRALASAPQPEKYFFTAKEILEDMESRNITTNDSYTASSVIVLLMKCAPSKAEALEVYYALRSSLDEKGYAIVLNAFCRLTFGGPPTVPSLSDYFAIVKDMRASGLEITVEVYTILLKQLGSLAVELKRSDHQSWQRMRDELVTTVRRTHDFLTLDAAVSPDAHVWNQLMDTYQRVNCFGDAYRVWETMYLAGRFDHISVSIILDACGHANAWHIARKVSAQLFRDRFSFDLHNWNSWIECLCRLGRLNDAVKVVCLEMGKNGVTVEPDVESLKILLKFAKRDGHYPAVSERLQRHVRGLWEGLPEDMRTPIDSNRSN